MKHLILGNLTELRPKIPAWLRVLLRLVRGHITKLHRSRIQSRIQSRIHQNDRIEQLTMSDILRYKAFGQRGWIVTVSRVRPANEQPLFLKRHSHFPGN